MKKVLIIKRNNSLSIDESLLLTKILEEYNDLFPEIMQLKKEDFLPLFQRYIQIYFASKNILADNYSNNKNQIKAFYGLLIIKN